MSNDIAKGNWKEMKGKVKQAWAKLTDNDVERFEGNFDELAGTVQKAYGYTKEKAWKEIEDFKAKHVEKLDKKSTNQ